MRNRRQKRINMLQKNNNGGLEDLDKDALSRAKHADLITFTQDIPGTNCFNCQWIRDKSQEAGYCSNKEIRQYVNGRMCCNYWNKPGTLRAWENK